MQYKMYKYKKVQLIELYFNFFIYALAGQAFFLLSPKKNQKRDDFSQSSSLFGNNVALIEAGESAFLK